MSLRKYDTWAFESRQLTRCDCAAPPTSRTLASISTTLQGCSCHDQNADDFCHRDCDRGARVRREASFRRAFLRLRAGDAAAATLARAFPPGSAGIGIRGFPAFRFSPVANDRRPRFEQA
ncbi:MAG TPA: hypothetical protein VN744_06060, partial [Casimicrobiaceae bacterium]|nr:hypothetical protein [Casimicrobiaceae bacterium]